MGTRNLVCIRINRQWAVAKYCQWDGYPSGQGLFLFHFLHVEENIARLRAGLPHIYKPTKEELKKSLPSLSRDIGGKILEFIVNATADDKLPIESELEFAADWLYCEWVYIVDLDEEQLKIFGCREPNHEGHPFEEVCGEGNDVPKLMASFAFTELQSWDQETFIKRAGDIEREVGALQEEQCIFSRKRLEECGITFVDGRIPHEGDTSESDTSGDGTNEDDADENNADGDNASEDTAHEEDTSGDDVNGDDVNGDGADAATSQLDRLHLD
ncbi:hypothetical protein F4818DRAFT_277983 [Hypoxylon cercidicola]|nr:hypothetical protein F4818DRAFT_277983 [Hypoxylon cercidicola]